MSPHLPTSFHRLAGSNLAAQTAEQIIRENPGIPALGEMNISIAVISGILETPDDARMGLALIPVS